MDTDLRESWLHGISVGAIARYIGVSEKAVLRRRVRLDLPPRTTDPQHDRAPVQVGPVLIGSARETHEQAILSKSMSSRTQKPAIAYSMSIPKAPSGPVEGTLELSVNPYTNQLEVVRVVEGIERRRLRARDVFYAFGGAWEKITGQREPRRPPG